VKVKPGMSETIFTLSLDAIFFLQPGAEREGWHWTWAGSVPRGASPVSPIHGQHALGWEVRRAESAVVAAEIEVDGRRVDSQPLEIRVPKLPIEVVKVLARFQSARVLLPDAPRRYEITFDVQEKYEGSLAKEERTLTLPDGDAEHLLAAADARPGKEPGTYRFDSPLMLLTCARVTTGERHSSHLILTAYDRPPAPQKPK